MTCFEIGRRIVEHAEQGGLTRAAYGKETLKKLSDRLTAEFGRGFSEDNLANMRKFHILWKERVKPISEKPSRKSSLMPFTLSWSHYVLLMSIKDASERSFCEIEATQNAWSMPELKRQYNSGLYERLALSRTKREYTSWRMRDRC